MGINIVVILMFCFILDLVFVVFWGGRLEYLRDKLESDLGKFS